MHRICSAVKISTRKIREEITDVLELLTRENLLPIMG